jgi:hypothetical protein
MSTQFRVKVLDQQPGAVEVKYVKPDGSLFGPQSGQVIKPGEDGTFVVHGSGSVLISRVALVSGTEESIVKPLKETCDDLRRELKGVEETLRALKKHPDVPDPRMAAPHGEKFKGQAGEMIAQLMLAVRHVEDARMRIGKVLQYADDGISILDKREA